MSHGPLSNIARIQTNVRSKRVSSYDRSGGNGDCVPIEPGATFTMAEIAGAGIVKHIWITISARDEMIRRNLVLRMYWDGCDHPSVESPIGDFFGQGWGEKYNFVSLPLAAAPRTGNALVCYFPMPFGKGARITVENQGTEKVDAFYYYVDYEEHPSIPDDMGRFHAWYNQELTQPESEQGDIENEWGIFQPSPKNPTDANNYLFCDVEGAGQFVGVNYYCHCPTPIWYGEGDDMFLVDGEPWPGSAHGTGSEDYFNQSWSPDEHYLHPYFGTARAPGRLNDDPLFGWLGRGHCYERGVLVSDHAAQALPGAGSVGGAPTPCEDHYGRRPPLARCLAQSDGRWRVVGQRTAVLTLEGPAPSGHNSGESEF